MVKFVAPALSPRFKWAVLGLAGVLLSGCSDSIERFSENYRNPSDIDPVYTASIKKPRPHIVADAPQVADEQIVQSPIAHAPVANAPEMKYADAYAKTYHAPKRRPVPQVAAAEPVDPPAPVEQPKVAYKKPAYKAPVLNNSDDTADAAPAATPANPKLQWRKGKSASVTVAEGMSLYSIAQANHITVKQLAEANHLQVPYAAKPGMQLVIPGTDKPVIPKVAAVAKPASQPEVVAQADDAPQQPAAAPSKKIDGAPITVAQGDTLFSLARKHNVSAFALADANKLQHDKPLKVGSTLVLPSKAGAATAQAEEPKAKAEQPKIKTEIAKAKPAPDAGTEQIADAKSDGPATLPPPPAAAAANGKLALRWPTHGRILSGFGPKNGGTKNEGINIAAPEGSKIQAADGGTVAYAGNELKGYGNLVLIRHDGGYVTAYAHAKQILVKKGDTVKRGDVIALVGQTGAVDAPQLHFEVRKGATALDPTTFLGNASASN